MKKEMFTVAVFNKDGLYFTKVSNPYDRDSKNLMEVERKILRFARRIWGGDTPVNRYRWRYLTELCDPYFLPRQELDLLSRGADRGVRKGCTNNPELAAIIREMAYDKRDLRDIPNAAEALAAAL